MECLLFGFYSASPFFSLWSITAQVDVVTASVSSVQVLTPLKEMLKTQKHHCVLRSVKAMQALAKDSENQKLIVKENLIPHLLKKAHCGVDEIEEAVTLTLALLAQNSVNRPKLMFHGGFKPLIYNMEYGCVSCRGAAVVSQGMRERHWFAAA